jgi:beta-fructofuranosidase
MRFGLALVAGAFAVAAPAGAQQAPPGRAASRVVFDFESGTYEGWARVGEAFGAGPSTGDRPGQSAVAGFCGRHLANSWGPNGDADTGTCTSPEFELTHDYLRLRIGGGDRGEHLGVRCLIDGDVRFTAAGDDSETLVARVWDVRRFRGRKARLVLVDEWVQGWGHVLLDHVELTDAPEGPACAIGHWRRIYDPSAANGGSWGWNDHCFLRTAAGWHLYGIEFREPGTPDTDGQWFGHALARTLGVAPWAKAERILPADHANGERRVWAPYVVRHAGRFYMFWCGCTDDWTRYRIQLAVSTDGNTWVRHPGNPVLIDGFQGRDPMVLRVGDRWVMYYCATVPPSGGHHTVNYALSDDLVTWQKGGVAFRHVARGTEFGPTESPFVVQRGEWFYLFIGPHPTYVGTDVYRSRDPFNFTLDQKVAHLHAHAAEVVQDGDGQWFVSHAGGGMGGVYLAPLYWNDGLDD